MKNRTFHVACDLPFHPKVKKLRRMVGSAGCWSLVCLWSYTAGFRPDGDLSNLTPGEIEEVSQWGGKKGKFFHALIACGFLSPEHQIHDWLEYNAYASNAKARQLAAQNAAQSRWSASPKKSRQNATPNDAPASKPHSQNSKPARASQKPRQNEHSSHAPASNGHHALADLYPTSSGSLSPLYPFSITDRENLHPSSIESLSPTESKGRDDGADDFCRVDEPLSHTGALPGALVAQDAGALPGALESGDAKEKEKEKEKEPPPTPPCGWGRREWEGDAGFAEWLARLWNWPIASVYQYLRKAKRDSTTALDAESFYRDYQRETQKPGTEIDWNSHPNREAYKARCAEDCYGFLLEFPPGSPERTLRASFVQWFLSQQKSPLSASQNAQEDAFVPDGVPEYDYDF